MIKNTTLTPHRSLYIPDHSQFALGIIGKYQYTTDNYLGMLGLTFRENLGAEALDAAPIYQYLIQLRLQILQLQHVNNRFMGSRSAILQMLHNKLNTNIELQQINQLLSQQEITYSNPNTHNHFISNQLIDRRLQASKQLSTPAYGRTIHSIQQATMQRNFRLTDLRVVVKEDDGAQKSTIINNVILSKPTYLSNQHFQQWNPLLEKTLYRDSKFLANNRIADPTQTVAFIKSLIQIDPQSPSANQTWNLAKRTIENRRYNTQLIDKKLINHRVEQTSSSLLFPIENNLTIQNELLIKPANVNNSDTLNSLFFEDKTAASKLTNSYLRNYNTVFGSSFVQYIVNKFSQTLVETEQLAATNPILVDRSLVQKGLSITHEQANNSLNVSVDNRDSTNTNNYNNTHQADLSIHNLFFKRIQPSSAFVQNIIEKQAYSASETNESYLYNDSTVINENKLSLSSRMQLTVRNENTHLDASINQHLNEQNISNLFYKSVQLSSHFAHSIVKKQAYSENESDEGNLSTDSIEINQGNLSISSRLQLTIRNQNTNLDATRHELLNEQNILNLFYKRVHESTNFVQAVLTKQAYTQQEINSYTKITEINDNKVSRLLSLQLTVHNSSFEAASAANGTPSSLLQINPILLRNLNIKHNISNNHSYSNILFANSLVHRIDEATVSNLTEFNRKLILVDRTQNNSVTGRDTFNVANSVYLKPNFLYTDANSKVYQKFRIHLLQAKQAVKALEYPDSPVQLANRLFASRIVQEHLSEPNILMQLNPTNITRQTLANYPIEILNEHKLSSWVQLNPMIIEQQAILTHNYSDNIQQDLNYSLYNGLNSLQLIERNYSTETHPNIDPILAASTVIQQINYQGNERKFQSFKTSLSPSVYQKFSLTQNRILHHENEIKRTLIDIQANTQVTSISNSNLIEKVVQTHINDWSAQIQSIPITTVNYLLDQVTNEAKTSFNEMNFNSAVSNNQALTLVERKGTENGSTQNELLIQNRISILQQSKEIVQKAIFLKQKTRELQEVSKPITLNTNASPNISTSTLFSNVSNYQETTINAGLKPALLQQLWLNNKLFHKTISNTANNNFQIRPELVKQIIQERIGDLTPIIQLNSTQVNNRLLLQTNVKDISSFNNAETSTNWLTKATFSNTHSTNLVDRKLIDRGLLQSTFNIRHQQTNQHINELQSLVQQFQAAPENLSFVLKQLNNYSDIQSIEHTYNPSHSGPVMSVITSLSPLIYKKYAIPLLDRRMIRIPVKRSLNRVITHKTRAQLEPATINVESNNLTERIVNERIHALSTLILQMPISSSNLLLHQLNMDIYRETELEKQLENNTIQSRLELVDRKVTERGGVSTLISGAFGRVYDQIKTSEGNLRAAVLVSLENSAVQNTERLVFHERVHFKSLTKNILSKVTNESYITGILNNSLKMVRIESNQTNYNQQKLTDKIINERVGEVASVLLLNSEPHDNLLFYANHSSRTINQLMDNNTLLLKEKFSLKLSDRKLIDRGLQAAAAAVITLQQRAYQQASARQILEKSSNEVLTRSEVFRHAAPILRQVIHQLKEYRSDLHTSSSGPVISYLSSLSPLVYQKFSYNNHSTKLAPDLHIKRRLSQAVPQQINIINSQMNNNTTMIQREINEQLDSAPLIYSENLTEKIVRERINEITHSTQLMALTNEKQISTQAQIQVITQAQQELEQQLAAIDSITEATEAKARPHLVLVDRNYTDHTIIQSVTDTLLSSSIQQRPKPEVLIDRNNRSVIQFRSREAPRITSFQSDETNILFRQLLTKKVVRAQVNDLLTQTAHSVSMQSLQKNLINQRFIEKVTTQLLVENERNESLESSFITNTESFLVNRRINQESAENTEEFAALMAQSETTLEYLKTKSTTAEPVQQSVANVLHQKEQIVAQSDQANGKVTPITKLEFDKIVDRVYKELQKRFTYERQRRGM